MKKNIALLAALLLGAVSASAQDAAPAAAPEAASGNTLAGSVSVAYDGKYVFRGVQCAEAIVSPAVNLTYGNFYGGLWFAVPVENSNDYVNEMDATVGYAFQATDLIKLDVGLTRYAYDEIVDDYLNENNSIEGYVGANFDTILAPAIYVYRDFDLCSYTFEGRIGHSIDLIKDFSLALGASVGYVGYDDDGDDYVYTNAKADLNYAIDDKSSASIGIRYGGCSEDYIGKHQDTNNAIWFGASVGTSF